MKDKQKLSHKCHQAPTLSETVIKQKNLINNCIVYYNIQKYFLHIDRYTPLFIINIYTSQHSISNDNTFTGKANMSEQNN